jgi:phenylpropionate dioxygenase-like ring-hydroxylating dioxygenase large terminal subunit
VSTAEVPQTVINPQAPPGSLEGKQAYVDNGTAVLDKTRYYSREFMQTEADLLWSKAWLLAGVVADIPQTGDYFLFDVGLESIIVTRTEEGIKAFHNVCSHRGNRLVNEERGNRNVFVCPFHSWSYNNDGSLRHVTDRETFRPELLCDSPGLVAVACAEKAGIVFVNMADNPSPLDAALGIPEGYLEAYNIDQMAVVRQVSSEWAANWKIGVEAFYESYHLHAVHPETRGVMGDLNVQYDLYPGGASRMIVPLGQPSPRAADQETVNEGLQAMLQDAGVDPQTFSGNAGEVRRAIQVSKRARAEQMGLDYSKLEDGQLSDSWATGLFPNVQIGCHPEGVFIMRFLPHESDPEKFYYDTMTLIFPADDPDYKPPAWMGIPGGTDLTGTTRPDCERYGPGEDANLGQVLNQDADLLPVVQRGIRSRGFKGQLWGEQEQRLRHFHAELERYLSDES